MDFDNSTLPDLTALTQEDLQHEYTNLYSQYQQLKQINDDGKQEIYNLKRSLQTASSAETYLAQELELLTSSQNSEIERVKQKHSREIEDFKNKYSDLASENTQLEQVVDCLKKQIENLNGNIEQLKLLQPQKVESVEVCEKEMQLEKENLDLHAKIDSLHGKVQNSLIAIAERERKIDIYGEEIQCLQENLNSKRLELDEKTNLLESAQERVAELNSELIALKSAPDNGNRKGNSLFAEVDDQRKAMKKLLQIQKKSFLELEKKFNDSEQEIRRLKRENAAMQKELQICISTFLSADKIYKEKLHQRIQQLLKRNEELEKKLTWTEDKLINVSKEKGVDFLDSMLLFCKNETHDLKTQLHSCLMQKGTLENSLRISQQEHAKWRFEALQARCIIIDRECLLEEHGIKFTPFKTFDYTALIVDIENNSPKIYLSSSNISSSLFSNCIEDKRQCGVSGNKESSIKSPPMNEISNSPEISGKNSIKNAELFSFRKNNEASKLNSKICKKFEGMSKNNLLLHSSNKTNEDLVDQNVNTSGHFTNQDKNNSAYLTTEISNNNSSDLQKLNNGRYSNELNFQIYEDTTCIYPIRANDVVKPTPPQYFDISVSEDTIQNIAGITTMKLGTEETTKIETIDDGERNQLGKDLFEIYEDTTTSIPAVRPNASLKNTPKQYCDETISEDTLEDTTALIKLVKSMQKNIVPFENKENVALLGNSTLKENQFPLQRDAQVERSNSSTLIKNRDVIGDSCKIKTEKFNKISGNAKKDGKLNVRQDKTNSNVIIRRIFVKSKTDKK